VKINIHLWLYLAQFFLKWEIFQINYVEKIKTHIFCSRTFFSLKNHSIYEIMCKNTVKLDRPQTIIWRMRIACWITKATDTRSVYVKLIDFTLQQWLHDRATILGLYVNDLSFYNFLGWRQMKICYPMFNFRYLNYIWHTPAPYTL
jgi:hypothetical protein